MAQNDTFTGKTPADTYTKIIQITDDNELLDGVGAAVSPTITGDLNVNGAIYKDGVELGSSTDSYWSEDSSGDLTRSSNVDVDGTIEANDINVPSNNSYNSKVGIGTVNPIGDIQIINAGISTIAIGNSSAIDGNNGVLVFGNTSLSFPYSNANSLDIINYGIGNVNFHLEAGTTGVSTGDFNWIRRKNFDHLMILTHAGRLGLGITLPDNEKILKEFVDLAIE